jgi:hypothetical protein
MQRFTEATITAFSAVVKSGAQLLPNVDHDLMRTYYIKMKNNFLPEYYVQLLDWHGGMSLASVQYIANMEKEKQGPLGSGLLANKTPIQRCMWEMQFLFQQWIGGEISPCSKYFVFNIAKCLAVWIDANVAQNTTLNLVFSSDGYALKGNEQGIAAFVKLGHTATLPRIEGSEADKLVGKTASKFNTMLLAQGFFPDNKANDVKLCDKAMKYAHTLHEAGEYIHPFTGARFPVCIRICQDMKALLLVCAF